MAVSAEFLISYLPRIPRQTEEWPPTPGAGTTMDLSGATGPHSGLDAGLDGSSSHGYTEAPLTSEPPLADEPPLTSEPALAAQLPLTSEPALAAGSDECVLSSARAATGIGGPEPGET